MSDNAEQIEYWNRQAGPKWVALQETLDAQIGELGELAVERGAPAPGERVLDVGCGCGSTSLALARRVGPDGAVLGADISAPMLARARERAAEADLEQLDFVEADAQTHGFDPTSFDLLFSRFGVMFFADPVAAFANLRRALRRNGRLAFVCWQPIVANPWMLVPVTAAAAHVEMPPPPAPDAPGPFAFGDPERVRSILTGAGFRDVAIDALEQDLILGGDGMNLEQAVQFALDLGPMSRLLIGADDSLRTRVGQAVHTALAPFAVDRGVMLPSACWLVTARV